MKPLTAKQVEEILSVHGFVRKFGVGSHFGWYNPITKRRTVVPHHANRILPQGMLIAIFRQAGIPKPPR